MFEKYENWDKLIIPYIEICRPYICLKLVICIAMFEENADWEGVELNSSLSEALLAKPVATPTKKSKNKFRPDAIPG